MNTATNTAPAAVLVPVKVGDRHPDITFTVSGATLGFDEHDAYFAGLEVCDAVREVLVDAREGDMAFAVVFVFTAREEVIVGQANDDLLADIARAGNAAIAEYIAAEAAEAA